MTAIKVVEGLMKKVSPLLRGFVSLAADEPAKAILHCRTYLEEFQTESVSGYPADDGPVDSDGPLMIV